MSESNQSYNKKINDSIIDAVRKEGEENKDEQQLEGYRKILIKNDDVMKIKSELASVGVHSGFIYPDIENYSKYLFDNFYSD